MRELLDRQRLRKLWWIDTRDMCADGLNKGSIDRKAIIDVIQHNVWSQVGDSPCALSCYSEEQIAQVTSCHAALAASEEPGKHSSSSWQLYDSMSSTITYLTGIFEKTFEDKNGYQTMLQWTLFDSTTGFIV